MTNLPKLTVITAAYNAEKYIAETIESVLRQSFRDFEYIIVDDRSNDGTVEIVRGFAERDQRVELLELEENSGPFVAANNALKTAKGEYIARIDADDLAREDRFAKQVEFLDKNQDHGLVGSHAQVIDATGKELFINAPVSDHPALLSRLFFYNQIIHSSTMYRRDTAEEVGFYTERRKAQDYDFYLKVLGTGVKLHNIPEPLVFYREHSENITNSSWDSQQDEVSKLLTRNYRDTLGIQELDEKTVVLIKNLGASSEGLIGTGFKDYLKFCRGIVKIRKALAVRFDIGAKSLDEGASSTIDKAFPKQTLLQKLKRYFAKLYLKLAVRM